MKDYKPEVIACGLYNGTLIPLLVDADGRLVYTGSDWHDWTPVLTWTGTAGNIDSMTAKWKDIGKIAFVHFQIVGASGGIHPLVSVSLPVEPLINVSMPVYTGWMPAIVEPNQFNDVKAYTKLTGFNTVVRFTDTVTFGNVAGCVLNGFCMYPIT